jgi:hypothetical protein
VETVWAGKEFKVAHGRTFRHSLARKIPVKRNRFRETLPGNLGQRLTHLRETVYLIRIEFPLLHVACLWRRRPHATYVWPRQGEVSSALSNSRRF